MGVSLCVFVHISAGPGKARRGHQIPLSLSFEQLCDTCCGSGSETPGQSELLTDESSLTPRIFSKLNLMGLINNKNTGESM